MLGTCNKCGACCRVLTTSSSPEELGTMAVLSRLFGIASDAVFLAEHWHPLTRDEAQQLNPFYTSRLPAGAHLYRCDQVAEDGRCLVHDTRPLVCRGYPWYDQPPRMMPLPDADCGYAIDQVTADPQRPPEP